MNAKKFRDLVCEHFGCSPEHYEKEVFWRCFYPQARAIGKLMSWFDPEFFEPDINMIKAVSDVINLEEFKIELNDFRLNNKPKGLLRERLRVRVSGQKLTNLAARLLASQLES